MFRRSNTGRDSRQEHGEGEDDEEEYPQDVEQEDYEEEDVHVMVELPAGMDLEALAVSKVVLKGAGSNTPQLIIGEKTLEGRTEPIIGTAMTFKTPPAGSAGKAPLVVECLSNLRLNFNLADNREKKRARR